LLEKLQIGVHNFLSILYLLIQPLTFLGMKKSMGARSITSRQRLQFYPTGLQFEKNHPPKAPFVQKMKGVRILESSGRLKRRVYEIAGSGQSK